jgi:DNA-binding CsgD family transcriptional regulator
VELIERDHELATLLAASRDVADAAGQVWAITGESGAGKSVLVDEVCRRATGMRVLRGLCDPLSTPRPLGPFRDVAADLGLASLGDGPGALAELCGDVFDAIGAEPSILVIEDAQWLDEASIDVLRFLLRRLEAIPVLLLITYRDGEIDPGHPLRPVLGDLARLSPGSTTVLPPMSLEGVERLLAGTDVDATAALELTGGNAFFVSEIARQRGPGLPSSVRNAVLAGVSDLSTEDLEALQLVAVAPDGLDDRLLPELELDLPTLRRLDATGLLTRSRRGIAFRHELARLAVEASIPMGGAAQLHARILDALERCGSDEYAVMTHHALAAADGERISRDAQRAADQAIRAGSHTEAVAFLRRALEHHAGPPGERARLLQRLSFEEYMVNRLDDAIDSIAAAQRIWGEIGDSTGEAQAFDRRATYEYYAGRSGIAEEHVRRATAVARQGAAEQGGHAMQSYGHALATRAYLAFRRSDFDVAARCERDAVAIAAELDDEVLRIRSRTIDATAAVARGDPGARAALLALVDEAMERSLDEIASMGLSNLVSIDVEQCRFREAEELLTRSLPFTVERDIKICNAWQTAVRSRLHLVRGRWEAALEDARRLLEEDAPPLTLVWPHLVVGLVELRRSGDGGDDLDAAWQLATRLGEPSARLAVLSALTERMWLTGGDDPRLRDPIGDLDGGPIPPDLVWSYGSWAVWLARLGHPLDLPSSIPEPFRSALEGSSSEASARWEQLGAPFDRALAAVDSDDLASQAAAIDAIDGLGAAATADRLRMELRRRGVTSVPSRRRASTRANPAGLTNRQLEVARLLAEGLTNAELAQRLYISAKTADHHVSAVLSKLGVSSRRDVARLTDVLGTG